MSEDNIEKLPSINDFQDSSEELPSVEEYLEEEIINELPSVEEYIEKKLSKCNMCKQSAYGEKYLWVGFLTDIRLEICAQCAKREIGGKSWQKRSLQLKNLKQK